MGPWAFLGPGNPWAVPTGQTTRIHNHPDHNQETGEEECHPQGQKNRRCQLYEASFSRDEAKRRLINITFRLERPGRGRDGE